MKTLWLKFVAAIPVPQDPPKIVEKLVWVATAISFLRVQGKKPMAVQQHGKTYSYEPARDMGFQAYQGIRYQLSQTSPWLHSTLTKYRAI